MNSLRLSIYLRTVMMVFEVVERNHSGIVLYIVAIQADMYTLPMAELHRELFAECVKRLGISAIKQLILVLRGIGFHAQIDGVVLERLLLDQLVVLCQIYFGRVGPISLAVALGSKNESQNVISEPTEDISIG